MSQGSPENHASGEYYSEYTSGTFARNGTIQDLAQSIYRYNVWIKILAISNVIGGIVLACTLIGLIIMWVPVWTGIILWKMSENIKNAATTGETAELETAFTRMRLFFKISGIIILFFIILYVFIAIFGISVISGIVYTSFFTG